jgi:hypothetical protein
MRPGWQTGAHTAGVPLNKMQSTVLGRYVPRVVDQPDGLNRAIRIMVENQRLVAKADEKVGLDAQCVCLPRVPQAPGIMLSNLDGHSIPTTNNSFGFFDADGFRYKQVGPLLAHGGGVMDQFEGTADPQNPDNQTVGFRYVKVPR